MEKDLKLVNIYIRIHNKQAITIEDLAYLARYNPTCFKKTCDNLLYKVPEAKALVEGTEDKLPAESAPETERLAVPVAGKLLSAVPTSAVEKEAYDAVGSAQHVSEKVPEELQDEYMIRQMIESLKEMEEGEAEHLQHIDITEVKELLGGLFMESLFPHSGLPEYFDICKEQNGMLFNARA